MTGAIDSFIGDAEFLPQERLPADAECKTDDDVGLALAELSYIASREKELCTALEQRIRLATFDVERHMTIGVREGRKTIEKSFADRNRELRCAISTYVERNRERFFAAGEKTRTMTFGAISYRKKPAYVSFLLGHDSKSALARILDRCDIMTRLAMLCARVKLFGLSISRFLKIEPSISISEIKRAWSEGKITSEQLREIGIEILADEETFSIALTEYFCASESRAA